MPNTEPGSPLWWVDRLEAELLRDQPAFKRYDDYYEGHHPLGFATPKFREAFGALFATFADNWCDLVIDAVEERLEVQGFRVPLENADERDAATGDQEAWRMWQSNNLDSEHRVAQTEALIHGRSYALVWFRDDDPNTPMITIEHPSQMVVATSATNRRERLAALKRWVDDDGYDRATLYLPDSIHRFRAKRALVVGATEGARLARWEPFRSEQDSVIRNPLGVVPVVPLINRRRLLNNGVSEIAKVIPIQDGVNKLVADMIVASEFGAAPQRWATGIEIPRDPATGQPLPMFENLIQRMWVSEKEGTSFGQFPQTNLAPFVQGVEMLVQHIASQTRTPPHYFYLRGQFPSGESIKSAETGLVAKAVRKQGTFGEAWEEVIRLGFLVIGDDERAKASGNETLWSDPESRSESEHVDAVMKKQALGYPEEALWEELGASPQQIVRWKQMRAEAALDPKPASVSDLDFEERVALLERYVRAGFDPEVAAKELGLPNVPLAETPASPTLPAFAQGEGD